MDTLIFIDKPKGMTSFGVIRMLRKKLDVRKIGHTHSTDSGQEHARPRIGHAGTLDPNATGLLIIGVGDGTKKLRDYSGLDKTYEAEVLFGMQTESGDITGKPVRKISNVKIQEEDIEKALSEMIQTLRLPVSKFSAKKIGGVPLYKKTYSGKATPNILQDMSVLDAKLNALGGATAHITFHVDSGTYIRSLAEELGRRLDLPATLKNLRRTKIGQFKVEDAEHL